MKPSIKFKTTPRLQRCSTAGRTSPLLALFALGCFALSPVAQAKQQSEDRGNGNSAAEDVDALNLATTGSDNTAHGWFSLFSNASGSSNTADGFQALYSNTSGEDNTANGLSALFSNTNGSSNTASGAQALFSNTTGIANTANGLQALFTNIDGFENTASGGRALFSNTTGHGNTASGAFALFGNTTGIHNTAIGRDALSFNTTGINNTALGVGAGSNLTIGNNNIDIGNNGVAGESDTIRIGQVQTSTFIAGIFGSAIAGTAVVVNANGQLGVVPSSRRFKDDIRPMDKASETLLALKPVTFRYKKEIDPTGRSQFGLVAEEVEKVNPDLVVRDKEGKPYSVRYDQVNAMLLNEFLKEHRMIEKQGSTLQKQEATIVRQQKQIDALTAGLQKVTAQLELSKPSPRTVLNDR